MRPSIGITGPDRGGFPAWFFTSWAIRAAGGRPVRITPRRGPPTDDLDGLIVGGGADVEPQRYAPYQPAPPVSEQLTGEDKARTLAGYLVAPAVYLIRRLFSVKDGPRVDADRDTLETDLLERALAQGIPILGICRGAQLLNVTLGGTLHRDLASFYVEQPRPWTVFPRKEVRVDGDSQLARVLGRAHVWVNSLHRQAVDRLGDRLRTTAREINGVVQGIEAPDHPFVIGVQWHPEYLPQRPEQRLLFGAFVHHARLHRQGARSASSAGTARA